MPFLTEELWAQTADLGAARGEGMLITARWPQLADTLIEAGERDGTARALIMALPERQRAAIVLTYYEELPNAEAAEAMDMNIKACESLLHRARAALRQAWTAQGDAP